jgi:hypothetical protein
MLREGKPDRGSKKRIEVLSTIDGLALHYRTDAGLNPVFDTPYNVAFMPQKSAADGCWINTLLELSLLGS